MRKALIQRGNKQPTSGSDERGFTMALVALAMFAVVAMAALSIDVGTLYQAKAEAQRAADAAALSAARVISLSGITGDPTNGNTDGSWADICGGASSPATLTAIAVAQQNTIGGVAPSTSNITVTYSAGSGGSSNSDCSSAGTEFGINPVVNVTVSQSNLPIFFARVFSLIPGVNYSGSSVSGSASAEGYNPSNSGNGGDVPTPVQPRCVKPWIVPNLSNTPPIRIVRRRSGVIENEGISQIGTGIIGQQFALRADCGTGTTCMPVGNPTWSTVAGGFNFPYVPAGISSPPGTPIAIPSCSTTDTYQEAIGGCDQTTVYACGVANGTTADLTQNPGPSGSGGNAGGNGDTPAATQCLINQSTGQDSLAPGGGTPTFPFQILAGAGNSLVAARLLSANNFITTSSSIVTIPIAEFTGTLAGGTTNLVTVVGFIQAFITNVDTTTGATGGNVNAIILNVSGCGDAATGGPVYGTSPVPVRLITPP